VLSELRRVDVGLERLRQRQHLAKRHLVRV
jgi:hypothetical protein